MANRIIKESIRTDRKINQITDFQFRIWVFLITYVDDFGRGSADPEILKGFLLPRRKGVTEKNVEDALRSLESIGLIRFYEVDGESYLYFPNWENHQRIQSKRSKFPEPPSTADHGESPSSTVSHGESPLESNPIQSNPNTNPNPNPNTKGGNSRFTPPSLEEVSEYVSENGLIVDPEQFMDYYSGNGWKVGKNSMKDWKATLRNWSRREQTKPNGRGPKISVPDYITKQEQGYYDEEEEHLW